MGTSWLQRLASFARRRYRLLFAVFGVLTGLSALAATRLSFDTDMLKLLPQQDPAIRAYVETLEDFGTFSYLLVVIRIPEGVVPDPYEMLADEVAAELRALPELERVEHRLGDPEELLRTFFPKAVLFLSPAERQAFELKLSDYGIAVRARELARLIKTPQGLAAKQLVRLDPFGLADIFFDRVQGSRGSLKVDWTSGYYLSQDHRLLLLLAQPKRPPADVDFVHGLVAAVDALVDRKLAEWPRIAGPEPPPTPVVALGGPYLTSLGDASLLRKDMLINIGTSTVSVFLLFLFAFRRKGALLYAFVPLLSAILITFGLLAVTIGHLSSATSVCAALLIGLGIDFVIVSYGRYIEERRRGAGLERALAAMSGHTGRAVVVGAVTTAATFYAFTFTDFTGLRQMGLMTGTGILICMATVLLLLPAMLAWADDRHARRQTEPNLYLHSLGTNVLMRFSMRHPRPVLLAGALVTLAAFALSTRLTFDESMKTMRPRGNRGMEVAEEVGRHFGSGFDSMLLLLTGDRLSEVLELSERAVAEARGLVAEGVLQGVSGVPSLIPAPQKQQEALEWLARARNSPLDMRRIRASFERQAAAQGLRVDGFTPGLELLEEAVSLARPVGVADFQASEQTALLLGRFLRKTDRGWKSAVYLYPPAGKWRREPPPQAVELAEKLGDRAVLSGVNVINQRVRQRVLRDGWIAGILGLIAVELLLWLNFRDLRLGLLGLFPVLVGIVWMLGAMVLAGIQMNFINIFVTTMIIGIGVDYAIYVLHRYREVGGASGKEVERGLVETGNSVVMASLATILGFGSITFSSYPGLQSTGKVAILGAFCACVVTITLLPAWLAWRHVEVEPVVEDLPEDEPLRETAAS
ncbi:MAG TPA: MMPL family transporter [Thermoanaerobaculia bacterium]|nr:MMPL family transporter [Thermoanaerobaculia bacterium]